MAEKTPQEHDLANELADFRKRIVNGETVTDEELAQAINKLRTFRDKTAAPVKAAAVKKATAKVTKKDANDFFGDLL